MIQPFTKGNPETRRKMNEIVDAVNNLMKMTGDGFVNVQRSPTGTTLSLNMNAIRARSINFGGGSVLHNAFAKAAAGGGSTIVCFLDTDTTGDEITVTIEIAGGSNLNAALPRLEDGTLLTVWDDAGTWRNAGNPFQASGDC